MLAIESMSSVVRVGAAKSVVGAKAKTRLRVEVVKSMVLQVCISPCILIGWGNKEQARFVYVV